MYARENSNGRPVRDGGAKKTNTAHGPLGPAGGCGRQPVAHLVAAADGERSVLLHRHLDAGGDGEDARLGVANVERQLLAGDRGTVTGTHHLHLLGEAGGHALDHVADQGPARQGSVWGTA